MDNRKKLQNLFVNPIQVNANFIEIKSKSELVNQSQTNDVFSEKWKKVEDNNEVENLVDFQKEWFLSLYGFDDEIELKSFLKDKEFIIDAGCGLGYKSAWLAEIAPQSIVIGIDYSEAARIAANKYGEHNNLFFVQGDIADTGIKNESIDFVLCDQVIMHTENPDLTFKHLSKITRSDGQFATYVYAKKALPRELLDDYFRIETSNIPTEELWDMSRQLTELGKRLSELKVEFECPDIPLLGIKGGVYDIQRFVYWNFLKCFYRDDWSTGLCDSTNFDWYSPSNARRYSEEEFKKLAIDNNLKTEYFHSEEACYSGRFLK